MRLSKILIAVGVLAVPLAALSGPAAAATASNSQAGAEGHNKNMEKNVGMHNKRVHHRKM